MLYTMDTEDYSTVLVEEFTMNELVERYALARAELQHATAFSNDADTLDSIQANADRLQHLMDRKIHVTVANDLALYGLDEEQFLHRVGEMFYADYDVDALHHERRRLENWVERIAVSDHGMTSHEPGAQTAVLQHNIAVIDKIVARLA